MGAHDFLRDLALVLSVAAVTTVLFQRLKQPVVLGYLLAGAIISPHTPIPLEADEDTVQTLAELGVILLMFSLGLEFSLRELVRVGPRAAFVAIVQSSLMIWLGFAVGRAFGWHPLESLFAGAAIAISSTTIIVKAFQEEGTKGTLVSLVFAVLIVEDLIAILLLALLTPLASGVALSPAEIGSALVRLGLFLAVVLVVGYLTVPRAIRFVLRIDRTETTLVACIGTCFAISYVSHAAGYSVALGAFLAGSLVAESGEAKKVERLVEPVRDMFAAIFFVAVGMMIDPRLVAEHWVAVLVFIAIVIAGKFLSVSIGSFLAGYGTRTSVKAGMSLAQIGEFSFIIAQVGLASGAVRPFLYPLAVAVSAATTLTTPWLIKSAPRVAAQVDGVLPRWVHTFSALYAAWIERFGSSPHERSFGRKVRRLALLVLVDAACIVMIVVGAWLGMDQAVHFLRETVQLSPGAARALLVGAATVVSTPFVIGILRCARGIGNLVAEQVLGSSVNATFGEAARSSLAIAVQLLVLLAIGAPLVAVTQPLFSIFPVASLLLLLLAAAFGLFKSARSLDVEVRAGVQTIVDALEQQLPAPEQSVEGGIPTPGDITSIRLEANDHAIEKSLAQLELRTRTGAIVLAIERHAYAAAVPSPDEPLHEGDRLAVAGTREAVEAAVALLRSGEPHSSAVRAGDSSS